MGFNDTWTPGLVDFIEDRELIDSHLKGPLDQLRETMLKSYEPNKLTSQTEFNAICLLQLSDPAINASNLIRVKARIPELHVMLPIPAGSTSAADLRTISLYPTYTGLKTDFNPQITPNSIQPGTRLTVSYENHSNFSGPAIVRVSDIRVAGSPPTGGSGGSGGTGGGSTPGTSSSSTSRSARRGNGWYWVTKPALKTGTVDLVKLVDSTTTGGPTNIWFRRQFGNNFQHGVPRMQEFFNGLAAATPLAGSDINNGGNKIIIEPGATSARSGAVPYVFKPGWYIGDVARSTGGPYGGSPDSYRPPRAAGSCGTDNWCLHRSHQSGIDVDMSIPQLVDERNVPLRRGALRDSGRHGMSIVRRATRSAWRFRWLRGKVVRTHNIDVVANLQFLIYCVDFCDDPSGRKRSGRTTGGAFLDQPLITHLKQEAQKVRADPSHSLHGKLTENIFKRIFGGGGKRGFLKHVPGHDDHYHIRLNTIGFNDKSGDPGKIDSDAPHGSLGT